MRAIPVLSLIFLLGPAATLAQSPPAPSAAPPEAAAPPPASSRSSATRGQDISRDEYITRAVERARRAAEKRFDRMDTNHDGVLTADERRAARAARRAQRDADSQ